MAGIIGNAPIVAGVDGSEPSAIAVRWAADEAIRRRAPLHLVFANGGATMNNTGGIAPPQSFYDAIEHDGRRLLTDARDAVMAAHPELDPVIEMSAAGPIPALVEASRDAGLMVLGSHGRGGFLGMLVGSTAVAVVAHGHCPVAVIRPHDDAGPVVVGVDGSPHSDAALAAALDEASSRGADLIAVYSLSDRLGESPLLASPDFAAERDVITAGERERLAERMTGWQQKYPDVAIRRVVTAEAPIPALLAHSAHARLIVVGSRGLGGITGMLVGSTSRALIHHATCPVMVVRA